MSDQGNGKPENPVSQLRLEPKTSIPLPKSQLERENVAPKVKSKWNTKNLPFRLAADLASATAAATVVAPLISIIDR